MIKQVNGEEFVEHIAREMKIRKEKTDEYLHYELLIDATTHLREHLFYSEFGGKLDDTDPWMDLYNGLSELRGKLQEEQEMCELAKNHE